MTSSRSRVLGIVMVVLRVVLAAIFGYAGYVKVRDPWQLFAAAIASYELVPMWTTEYIARFFPWFEIALAVGLVIGWRLLKPSAILTAGLILFFNVMLWRAFLQGKTIECGCFGPGEALDWKTLLRDGSMLVAAVVVVWWSFASRRARPAA